MQTSTSQKVITREILEQTMELHTGKMKTPEGGYSATYFYECDPRYWAWGPTEQEAITTLNAQVDKYERECIARFKWIDSSALNREAEAHLRKAGIPLLCVTFKYRATFVHVTLDYVRDIPAAVKAFTDLHHDFRKNSYQYGTTIQFEKQTA